MKRTLSKSALKKRFAPLRENHIDGEVIVADNGSTDGSREIAARLGARVIPVAQKGYGSALMGGIAAARGRYVIMGDADDSYDFLEIPRFVESLRKGYDLVQGCRLPVGGGTVVPGAMPFLHRWWGNPMFSTMAQWWFGASVHDVYCGMRGFTKTLYERLDQRCTGMEFATEMIIKSSMRGEQVAEVPITLHPDGRKAHAPHLRTFRDGWRTLRFFLMYSPRWLFFMPGLLLILLGLLGYAIALPGITIMGVTFDAHTLLFATLAILCGYQSVLFALFTKTFAISEGLMPEDPRLEFFEAIELERGLMGGGVFLLTGIALLIESINQWRVADSASRLRTHHALGDSRRSPDGTGISNHPFFFFPQHPEEATAMSRSRRSYKPGSDAMPENYDETSGARAGGVWRTTAATLPRGRVLWLEAIACNNCGETPRSDLRLWLRHWVRLRHTLLMSLLCADVVVGLDVFRRNSSMRAHQKYGSERSRFLQIDQYQPIAQLDLAYCNGVFHHIPVSKRDQVVAYIARTLRPGELFALWENNP